MYVFTCMYIYKQFIYIERENQSVDSSQLLCSLRAHQYSLDQMKILKQKTTA